MKDWKRFEANRQNEIDLQDSVSAQIVQTLGSSFPDSFINKSQTERTIYVMNALSRLGRKLGFKSMSRGIHDDLKKEGFKKREWLYDLHWYQENESAHYQQTSLPLAVECEWDWLRDADRSDDKFSGIKWDFQKLLVANADLRVMIFQQRVEDGANLNSDLDEYFTKTINGYRNLPLGSKFLFIAFGNNGFLYSEKVRREL